MWAFIVYLHAKAVVHSHFWSHSDFGATWMGTYMTAPQILIPSWQNSWLYSCSDSSLWLLLHLSCRYSAAIIVPKGPFLTSTCMWNVMCLCRSSGVWQGCRMGRTTGVCGGVVCLIWWWQLRHLYQSSSLASSSSSSPVSSSTSFSLHSSPFSVSSFSPTAFKKYFLPTTIRKYALWKTHATSYHCSACG